MTWNSSPRIAAILDGERSILDELFGLGKFEIEDVDPNEAIIRSARFVLGFVYDRDRVGDVMTYLSPDGPTSEPIHSLEMWARFLGEEWPTVPTSKTGKVTISAEEQVRGNLAIAVRLIRDIFSDDQKARDATSFAEGYHRAYNDWASGKGNWK